MLKTNTKGLIALVVVVGAGALGYGGYSIMQDIRTPFKLEGFPADQLLALAPVNADQEAEKQKKLDTDSDGLNDYEEINLYGTSPYLADSDSDGLTDSAEVKSGDDPNCAKGEECRAIRLVTPDTKISDLFPQFSSSNVTLRDKTIQEFRQIILNEGYDPEKLKEIDDQTLLIILEESLKLQDQATSTPAEEPADLDNVRLLLIDMGVPEDEVYSMSNQEIEELLKSLQ